jgi:hypothetical protein
LQQTREIVRLVEIVVLDKKTFAIPKKNGTIELSFSQKEKQFSIPKNRGMIHSMKEFILNTTWN